MLFLSEKELLSWTYVLKKTLWRKKNNIFICKNIFACLFSIHNTISLSRHEQVCLSRGYVSRDTSPIIEPWSGKYLLKCSPLKHTCSWRDKLIVLLISPVWNKILKIWDPFSELIQIEVQCSKNYFKIFLSEQDGTSGKI